MSKAQRFRLLWVSIVTIVAALAIQFLLQDKPPYELNRIETWFAIASFFLSIGGGLGVVIAVIDYIEAGHGKD